MIEAGFAQDETSAAVSFYPVDPVDPQPTAHQSFAVRGSDPFRATIGLGEYGRCDAFITDRDGRPARRFGDDPGLEMTLGSR